MKFKKLSALLLATSLVAGMQLATLGSANALDTNADLGLYSTSGFNNGGIATDICNGATSPTVTQFVLDIDVTNYAFDEAFVTPFNDPAPLDKGSFDLETMTWTGQLDANRCVSIWVTGQGTAGIGSEVTASVTLVSSLLEGDVVNDETGIDGNNTSVVTPFTVALAPDLELTTRLATPGAILEDSALTYEATIENIGTGDYVDDNGLFILAFVMPVDSTLVSVTDGNSGDFLTTDAECQEIGPISGLGFAGLSAYSGNVVICNLAATSSLPQGGSYPFDINIIAGAPFAAGDAEVIGILEGNDADTLGLFRSLSLGLDPLSIGSNNVVYLNYDPSALQATSARCPGQSETTTDGTGCFRITFNKIIFEDTFTAADIDLGGNGAVVSVTQVDEYSFDVQISGISPNSTVTMLLDLDEIIQDYSAVQNGSQVLGINTIRYDVDDASGSASGSTSAGGTLAETGLKTSQLQTSFMLLAMGLVILAIARRRKVTI